MAYNKLNQIAINGYKYDTWGNLIQTPDTSYKYDLNNRLVEVKKGNVTVSYKYDALGQRIEAKESIDDSQKTTKFLMSGMVEYARFSESKAQYHTLGLDLAQSLNKTGAVGAVLASTKGSDSFHYLYDGNSNVTATCDSKGAIKEKVTYSPFGENLSRINLPFSFSTKAIDVSGLSYYGFRFYNAELSRWLTRDLLKELGGGNLYGFVHANNEVDFLGLINYKETFYTIPEGSFDTVDQFFKDMNGSYGHVTSSIVLNTAQVVYETTREVKSADCDCADKYTSICYQFVSQDVAINVLLPGSAPSMENWSNAQQVALLEAVSKVNVPC